MLQICRDLDVAQESFGAQHFAEPGLQHFDGDITIVLDVVREIQGGHAAGTEFALDAIAVGQGGSEALHHAHDANAGIVRGITVPPSADRRPRRTESV